MTKNTEETTIPVLTNADVASLVSRVVPVLEDGKPKLNKNNEAVTKEVNIKADEVLNHAVYPDADKVVVVTTGGEKLVGKLSDLKAKK